MNKKREIPRHVDGRVKIGFIPIKSFFKILPICLLIFILALSNLTPVSLFLAFLLISILVLMVSELSHKETGVNIVKDIIRYEKQGDIFFERNTLLIPEYRKIINFDIDTKIDKENK